MTDCEETLLGICKPLVTNLYAWCVLPNHYHILLRTEQIKEVLEQLGGFHGSSSHEWNGEVHKRGRKVWQNCFERFMGLEKAKEMWLRYPILDYGKKWDI